MKNKKNSISYSKYGYLFSIPFVVTFLLCTLYPIIYTCIIGFTNLQGLVPPEKLTLPDIAVEIYADQIDSLELSPDQIKKITIPEDKNEPILISDKLQNVLKLTPEQKENLIKVAKKNTKFFSVKRFFSNFKEIISNKSFKTALFNTFFMWTINFIPQIVLALVLAAWFTNEQNNIKGKGFFKVVFYMPNIITASTIAILFASLFAYPTSPVNDLLQTLGVIEKPFDFPQSKLAARLIVAFIQFWMWYGYTMIVLTSGILGISPEIYEAAEIDGANGPQKFFKITLPNLKTIMLFTLVTSLIGGLQMYDIPSLLMQNSGPDNATLTTSVFIYNQAFKGSYMYNRSAAASMIMFIIIAVLSAIMFYLLRDKDEAKLYKENKKRIKEYERQQKANGGNK